MTSSGDDPSIDELLRDPMTRALMKADRVDPAGLEAMLRCLALTAEPAKWSAVIPSVKDHTSSDRDVGKAPARVRRQCHIGARLALMRNVDSQICGVP